MKMLTSAKAKLLKGKKNQEEESIDNKKIKVSKAFLIFTFKSFNYKHFHKPFLTQLPKQLLLRWCEFVYPSCTRFWVCQQISAMFEVKHLGLDSYDIPPQNRSPWPHEAMEPWLLRSQDCSVFCWVATKRWEPVCVPPHSHKVMKIHLFMVCQQQKLGKKILD